MCMEPEATCRKYFDLTGKRGKRIEWGCRRRDDWQHNHTLRKVCWIDSHYAVRADRENERDNEKKEKERTVRSRDREGETNCQEISPIYFCPVSFLFLCIFLFFLGFFSSTLVAYLPPTTNVA